MPIHGVAHFLQPSDAWKRWNMEYGHQQGPLLEIQTVHVQEQADLLNYLEATYGSDWRDRPVLFKNLWNHASLNNSQRRLSLHGLLQENLTIPYFTDARKYGALSPDAEAPLHEIMINITQGAPHKIGTQFLVQTYPELIQEVAPVELVTQLFGRYFEPQYLFGRNGGILPGMTTVPIFVANGNVKAPNESLPVCQSEQVQGSDGNGSCRRHPAPDKEEPLPLERPYTGLHCEPIAILSLSTYST